MADERQEQNPPWDSPEDEGTTEQPQAAEAEEAYHDEPEGAGDPQAMEQPSGEGRSASEMDSEEEASEYEWHQGVTRDHGSEDAVEFIDVVKAFGRNTVLNGLNLGLPENQISMILGPSGTGKSVCIKHMVGLL